MSTSRPARVARTVEACRPSDATPVTVDAASLESTAPDHLLDLKREFAEEGLVPAAYAVEARFEEASSLAVQAEADRIRDEVRAASYLGATRVTVSVTAAEDEGTVASALRACEERARREGILLDVEGPVTLA